METPGVPDIEVLHNEAEHRFEAHVQGQTAFLTYRLFPDRFVMVHTEVPPAIDHHGIAGKLVKKALDFARASHLRLVPLCPYVADFIRKHPEYQDMLSPQDRQRLLDEAHDAEDAAKQRAEVLKLMAFYEIARRANLTNHPDLMTSPIFQKGSELYQSRAKYWWETFRSQEAIDDYLKLHLEGALAREGKSWEDLWSEFAPDSLKKYPLADGTL